MVMSYIEVLPPDISLPGMASVVVLLMCSRTIRCNTLMKEVISRSM